MSKRLEEEYKKMIEGEVPDLWARIESNLPEKNVAPSEPEPVLQTPEKKKPVIFRVLPWVGGVMAAAVILMIAIPAAVISNKAKKGMESTGAVVNAVMEEAAMDEATEGERANFTDQAVDEVQIEEPGASGMGENYDFYAGEKGKALQGFTAGENALSTEKRESGQNSVKDAVGGAAVAEATATEDNKRVSLDAQTEAEEEEVQYICINDVETVGGITFCYFCCSTNIKDFFDDQLSLEQIKLELSRDSVCEPQTGKIYLGDFPDEKLRLLEEVEDN